MEIIKRFFFFLCCFFIAINSVNADLLDNNEIYYTFDGDFNDTINSIDLTSNGDVSTSSSEFVIGESAQFDGTGDFLDYTTGINSLISGNDELTVSLWLYPQSGDYKMATISRDGSTQQFFISKSSSQEVIVLINTGSQISYTTTGIIGLNEWTHVVLRYNSTHLCAYINGSEDGCIAKTGNIINVATSDFRIGRNSAGASAQDWQGFIDEYSLWTRALNDSEIELLYNNGKGIQYPYIQVPIIETDLVSSYNTSNITVNLNTNTGENTNMSYSLDGASEVSICNNCNSSQVNLTVSPDGIHNITWVSTFSGEQLNTSQSFTIDTTNPQLIVNLPSEYNYYDGFNFSNYINYSDNIAISSCIVEISGETSTTCNSTSYSFSTATNKTINVTLTDTAGNINESLNNIMFVNPYQTFRFNSTTGLLVDYSFFNGTWATEDAVIKLYDIGLGNTNITFSKLGYETTEINLNLNNTSNINTTYNVSEAQISLRIRDKDSFDILTGINFTIQLVGDTGVLTSTTTGTAIISNAVLTESNYRLIVSNANYTTESLFFDFNNTEDLAVTAYPLLRNDTRYGIIIGDVKGTSDQPLSGVIVDALQWDASTSSYIKVSSDKTGGDGKANLNIILDDKLYIFKATQGTLTSQSPEEEISSAENGKEIPLILGAQSVTLDYIFKDVIASSNESFDNTTNQSTISFRWSNLAGTDVQGCINIYKIIGSQESLITQDCVTSSSTEMQRNYFVNSSLDVVIKTEFLKDGVYYVESRYYHPSSLGIGYIFDEYNLMGSFALFLSILAVIVGFAIGNIYISGIAIIIISFISAFGMKYISSTMAFVITVMVILAIWGGYKRR